MAVMGLLMTVVPALLQVPAVSAQQNAAQTATVERRTLTATVDSSGTIAAEQTVGLAFSTSGTVRQVGVKVGDTVKGGQELARLDTADLDYQVKLKEQALVVRQTSYDALVAPPTDEEIAQAKANLASAQSQLTSAQASLNTAPNQTTINCSDTDAKRQKLDDAKRDYADYVKNGYKWDATFKPDPDSTVAQTLTDAQRAYDVQEATCGKTTQTGEYQIQVAAAQASVDQAQAALDKLMKGATQTDIDSSKAQLEQARLELENARANLNNAIISAPFAGVVTAVNISVGETVGSGSAAITLVDNSQLHVDVSVDEQDIAKVALGQKVTIAPDALENQTFEGAVARIAPAGETKDNVVTYSVRVDLKDISKAPVKIGMTTDVQINVGSDANVLVVPTDAIQRDGQEEYVQVSNGSGAPSRVVVKTGQTSDGYTEVTGDLKEGVVVIVPTKTTTQQSGFPGPFGGG
jgi:HlyD family secretion protein